jgi:methionyl-tRNA formyltransferase
MRLGRFLPGYTLEHVVGHRLNDIRRLARRHGFKLVVTNSINSDPAALDALRHSEAEFLLVQGGRILKPSTLKAFKGIWLNGHGGYLPQYRGMHSEYWALKHRDYDRIGVSIHVLVVRLDGGPILQRSCISYDPREPYGDLLLRNHANLVSTYVEFVRRLAERPAGAGLSGFELIPNSPVGPCYSAPAGVDMMRLAATPAGEVR